MKDDDILYHYTTISGLNGILSSGKVWASDCRYLNDRNELVHAINLLLNRLEGDTKKMLEYALSSYSISRYHCVFALSQSPKVLSQWRAYADDGRGAAIGFSRKYLSGIGNTSTLAVANCIYDNFEQYIDDIVSGSKEDFETLQSMHSDSSGAVNTFWQLIDDNPAPLTRLFSNLLRIKNPAFREEQEVRLIISVSKKNIQTRVTNGLIVPYIDHQFLPDEDESFMWCIIPEIWLGPKSDKRNTEALHAFNQFGWDIHGIFHYDCGYT